MRITRTVPTPTTTDVDSALLPALDAEMDVAAIVTYDEPTESITDYAPYTLKVNGVTQPGG
jgi:hypothetical protein